MDPDGLRIQPLEFTVGLGVEINSFLTDKHLNRNEGMITPCTLSGAIAAKWTAASNNQNIFHQYDVDYPGDRKRNVKYLSRSTHSEAVFNGEYLDLSRQNAGSKNYGKVYPIILDRRNIPHLVLDVIPYKIWGDSFPSEGCICQANGL